ncbi:MAG: MBL fold metallo-hydrolase [Chitinophagaceae bacterium]
MRQCLLLLLLVITLKINAQQPYIQLLGTAQDAEYPQMGCTKDCCREAWRNDSLRRWVVSFALVDPVEKKWWLFEATPDIKYQLQLFHQLNKGQYSFLPEGIFLTHAHIGHYTGLMQLGREVMNTSNIPVYTLPKLKNFLESNGPWSQLVKLNNIALQPLQADSGFTINSRIRVTAFTVPHRDEYSETAGFRIEAGNRKILFIPDIDKWEKWNRNIVQETASADIALVDATFYDINELPGRNIREIPHPFVTETTTLFKTAPAAVRSKLYLIHFNHTNPLLRNDSIRKAILQQGFHIAEQGAIL